MTNQEHFDEWKRLTLLDLQEVAGEAEMAGDLQLASEIKALIEKHAAPKLVEVSA